jgi:hypothetical protein
MSSHRWLLLSVLAAVGCPNSSADRGTHVDVRFDLKARDAVRPRLSLKLTVTSDLGTVYEGEAPLAPSSPRQIRGTFTISAPPLETPLAFNVQVLKQGMATPLLDITSHATLKSTGGTVPINSDTVIVPVDAFYSALLEYPYNFLGSGAFNFKASAAYCIDDSDCHGVRCTDAGLCAGTCDVDTRAMFAPLVATQPCYDWLTVVSDCDVLGLGHGPITCTPSCSLDVSRCGESCAGIGAVCSSDAECCGTAQCDRVCRYGSRDWAEFSTLAPASGWNSLFEYVYSRNSPGEFGRVLVAAGAAGLTRFTIAAPGSSDNGTAYDSGTSVTAARGETCMVADGQLQLSGGVAPLPTSEPIAGLDCGAAGVAIVDTAGNVYLRTAASGDWLPAVVVRPGVALRAAALNGDDVWVVGDQGTVARVTVSTSAFELLASSGPNLHGVFVDSKGTWAVGEGGTVLACGSGTCTGLTAAIGVTATLRATWGDGYQVWAVGDGGTIVTFPEDAPSWFRNESNPAFGDLVAVTGLNLEKLSGLHVYASVFRGVEVMALGASGTVYRRIAPDL